ncbi:hypothetical protein CDD80_4619 [Ophiocordyceps camponoti-rufipedis]|uniref:Peptidase S8/S53 domain-containing protein n=1 Tax=Ophiocordyceps camponoti-rufipedis TaxID=2004952 RepID=A0A2C5YN39_9HYPO|nr:hypothetical protein CDD80_4619 [Ophiocordyceps camponoti-rufipedis]
MAGHFILRVLAVLILASSLALASVEASTQVDDSYIITLRQSLPEDRVQDHLQWVDDTHQINKLSRRAADWTTGLQAVFNVGEFRGYGGHFDEETIKEIKSHPLNQFVGVHGIASQQGTWGLGTLSSRVPGDAQYLYDSSAGQDTWAYVLDTGINTEHQDFGGRAVKGADCGNVLCLPGGNFNDTLGHGTHVAGVIAGTRFGVAKKANIVDVKLAGSGNAITVLSTVSALNWAYNDMESKGRTNRSIINLSVGGQCNKRLDKPHGCPHAPYWGLHGHEAELDIIEMLYQRGVLTIVAAGNDDTEASWVAPAAAPNALTVGAIDQAWTEARFSNYGDGVNILAPGVNITSAGNRYSDDMRVFGGTSMAVPHVTGLALYLKALENITDPRVLVDRIMGLASYNSFGLHKKGSPRQVVNNGIVDSLGSLNESISTTSGSGSVTSGVDVPMPTTEVVKTATEDGTLTRSVDTPAPTMVVTINGTLTSSTAPPTGTTTKSTFNSTLTDVPTPPTDATTKITSNSTLEDVPTPPTDSPTMSTIIVTLTSSVDPPSSPTDVMTFIINSTLTGSVGMPTPESTTNETTLSTMSGTSTISSVDMPTPPTNTVTMSTTNITLTTVPTPATDTITIPAINSSLPGSVDVPTPNPDTNRTTLSTTSGTFNVDTPTPSTNLLPPSNNTSTPLPTDISADAPSPATSSTILPPTPTTASSVTELVISTPIQGNVFSPITQPASTQMTSMTRQSVSTAGCESEPKTRQGTAINDDCAEANEPTSLQSVIPIDTEPITVDVADPTIGSGCLERNSGNVTGCRSTPKPTRSVTVSATESFDSSTSSVANHVVKPTPTSDDDQPSTTAESNLSEKTTAAAKKMRASSSPDESESVDAPVLLMSEQVYERRLHGCPAQTLPSMTLRSNHDIHLDGDDILLLPAEEIHVLNLQEEIDVAS